MNEIQPPVTIQEMMMATGQGRETVKALIRTGQLPGQELGQRYVIPRGEFDAWYEGKWTPKPVEPRAPPSADPDAV
jgi:excisionase family DNA binding protein